MRSLPPKGIGSHYSSLSSLAQPRTKIAAAAKKKMMRTMQMTSSIAGSPFDRAALAAPIARCFRPPAMNVPPPRVRRASGGGANA